MSRQHAAMWLCTLGLVVFSGLALPQTPASGTLFVEGHVLTGQTGEPIANAEVTLTPVSGGGRFTSRTDSEGRFELRGLSAGVYNLRAARPPLVPAKRFPLSLTLDLSLGQPVRNVKVELVPPAAIAGRIYNEERVPQRAVRVEAFRWEYSLEGVRVLRNAGQALAGQALSDDRGEYRIFNLAPDTYFVRVSAPPNDSGREAAPKYYPGVSEARDASPIRLSAGTDATGIDFSIDRLPTYCATVGIHGASSAGQFASIQVKSVRRNAVADAVDLRPQNLGNGLYRFCGLPRGDYDILAEASLSAGALTFTHSGKTFIGIEDKDVENVRLSVLPNMVIEGQIVTAGLNRTLSFQNLNIFLRPVGGLAGSFGTSLRASNGSISDSGSFALGNVAKGHFRIEVSGLPAGIYLAGAQYGTTDVLDTGIVIDEDQRELRLTLRDDTGAIEGVVRDVVGKGVSNALVALIPSVNRRQNPAAYKSVTTDQDGKFSLPHIAPGSYSLAAWEEIPPNAYLNSDFFAPFEGGSTRIGVLPGSSQPVELRAIPPN